MSTTTRNKNLIFIIAALLLTNIAVLVYFLWIKEPDHKPKENKSRGNNGMTEILQKEVGFNEQQVAQYKQLKDVQWETIKPMFDQMRKSKDSLWRMMSDSTASDSAISKAADVIAQRQKTLDLQTFAHFKRVRAICTPDQLAKYDTAVLRMFSRMGKPAKRNDTDKSKEKK
jgi:periplasmic protein CpxP/Spy